MSKPACGAAWVRRLLSSLTANSTSLSRAVQVLFPLSARPLALDRADRLDPPRRAEVAHLPLAPDPAALDPVDLDPADLLPRAALLLRLLSRRSCWYSFWTAKHRSQ
jgi:hypothetical protein